MRDAIVVGHSWGAMVALALALDHRRIVSGVVLLSGYYHGTIRLDVFALSPPAIPVLDDMPAHTIAPLTGALLALAVTEAKFALAPVSEEVRRSVYRPDAAPITGARDGGEQRADDIGRDTN